MELRDLHFGPPETQNSGIYQCVTAIIPRGDRDILRSKMGIPDITELIVQEICVLLEQVPGLTRIQRLEEGGELFWEALHHMKEVPMNHLSDLIIVVRAKIQKRVVFEYSAHHTLQ